jgi:hypothetical protein
MVVVDVDDPGRRLDRLVRFLAGDVGLRQFLDIGAGLPTTNNMHEVAPLGSSVLRAGSYNPARPFRSRGPPHIADRQCRVPSLLLSPELLRRGRKYLITILVHLVR